MTTETTTTAGETGGRTSIGRIFTAVIRVLLGLMFLVFGLNGFLNFLRPQKDIPADVMTVSGALVQGGYMAVVSGTEVLVAVLLLLNRFVPLALALLAPIVVGIITFHVALAPSTIGPGIVVLVMELYLAFAYRRAFRPMLAMKNTPGGS